MKFILIITIILGIPGEQSKEIELRIPHQNRTECQKAAEKFTFSLPVLSLDTRCEPSKGDQEPEVRGVNL
ncbi:MAG: hypothetical protein CFH06_01660 [Alphaproteobacteria bacterium MarineAlpha3_Bin5]|nr:hypothetical protein [Magnetovibrio sp.]PPR76750.1 MAG: hypothetical protein CFH06_01660 [Alphaproteobacteria bacterium MarineAlpha3_Bin5]|tara:strand:+ start:3127 stop:3336 length:210 start_codon:yes stop_codon:yes gene_type:complete